MPPAKNRPGELAHALEAVASGRADALFVERLSAVAGSLGELVRLIEWLQAVGANLIAADVELDTRTRSGRRSVALLREIESWARARPRGRPGLATAAPDVAERIAHLRERGLSLHAIASELNAEGIPTPRGGREWRASSVQSAIGYRRPRPPLRGAPRHRPPAPAPPPHRRSRP